MTNNVQFALPRPKRGLRVLLVLYGVLGVASAIAWNYTSSGPTLWEWLVIRPLTLLTKPWTFVTAGLLTDPEHMGHLLFTLIGFYFLSPDLERRWGTGRFLRFIGLSIVAGFALALAVAKITPGEIKVLHPVAMFGPSAALAALAVAWGRENRAAQIRLFFFLPISGAALVWITLGFCVLGVIFPGSVTEGVIAPFGGFLAGLLFAGSPSPIRTFYLRMKLFVLRRRGPTVHIDLEPRPRKRSASSTPLRIVQGGQGDELDKRNPKDKRYLN